VNDRFGGHDDEHDPEHVTQTVKCTRVYDHQPQRNRPDHGDEKQQPQPQLPSITPHGHERRRVQKKHREHFRAAQ